MHCQSQPAAATLRSYYKLSWAFLQTRSISKYFSGYAHKGLTSVFQRGTDDMQKPTSMMTPEEKLTQYDSRAQTFVDTQQFDACIEDLVRCVALSRLVYGDGHLKLAQAHVRLAKAYLQFKGWPMQALEHSARASDLLSLGPPSSTSQEDRVHVLTCVLDIYLTQGGSSLLLANLEESASNHLKAEKIVGELHQLGGISEEQKMKTEVEISTSLSRVYQQQGQSEEALRQCNRCLELLEVLERPGQACSIYQDMASIEQAQGRADKAIEPLSKAHAIALSQSPRGLDGAHIAHCLALAYSTVAEPLHNETAAQYFEESLRAYRSSLGPQDAVTLNVQDDYCHFLLLTGQQERFVEIQRESLHLKRETFGDLSPEVADTLQLIGGVEMTQGQVKQAHVTMTKCLDIQCILYGPQHKKTRATQNTVDMLAQAPEVAGKQRDRNLKTRPPFCAVLPSYRRAGGNGNIS
ncbi:tetratricopeptide repeat protein 23 isoform X2 [Esox lucius]|uniref:Tetratricopeptide repeat domain 23 n=2 Tax=Esox lucius TaxID=8010 RepID=A0AAY5L6A2_ESOLU|nr:tetratricopeptide repeat protein 23 isoform X2 [Esox lucius]